MARPKKDKNGNQKPDDNNKKESPAPIILSKNEKAAVEELLRNAFTEYSTKFEAKKIERVETVQKISGFVSEFLSAFMIIGYDMKGRPINVIHAGNQMDADALTAALNKFLFNLNNMDE